MKKTDEKKATWQQLIEQIASFITSSSTLKLTFQEGDKAIIHQAADNKNLEFYAAEIGDVLSREDKDGKAFIQVNFVTGRKILITENLVGFKPEPQKGLDLSRLPKVVTTPDLMSVFEAIEEAMHIDPTTPEEVDVLKRVYHSILEGGEAVGFDLKSEKTWLSRLTTPHKASA